MKPSSRMAFVERWTKRTAPTATTPPCRSRAQLDGWMTDLGFKRAERVDLSPDKWFAVYSR